MDWHREYEALAERDKEQFARLVSQLFEETFLVRDVWDGRENRMTGNPSYRLAERLRPILEAYLAVSGWAIQVDSLRGVIALYNRFGRNRQHVDKLTTYLLFVLRMIYDEHLEQVSARREIVISLRDLYERLHALGFMDKKLAATRMQAVLLRLGKWSVLARVEGDGVEPDSRWLIYPSIRLLVSDERVNQIYERLEQGGLGEDGGDEDEDDDGEVAVDESPQAAVAAEERATDFEEGGVEA